MKMATSSILNPVVGFSSRQGLAGSKVDMSRQMAVKVVKVDELMSSSLLILVPVSWLVVCLISSLQK